MELLGHKFNKDHKVRKTSFLGKHSAEIQKTNEQHA